jgi:hypothetical protein
MSTREEALRSTLVLALSIGCSANTVGLDSVDAGVLDPTVDASPADPSADGPVKLGEPGSWCDPALSSGDGTNPACLPIERCVVRDDPPQNGLCAVVGCTVDLPTASINEDSCRGPLGNNYVCVDLDGANDDAEPYNSSHPQGQNTDLSDNLCVRKCTPRADGNDCEPQFACRPDSTRYDLLHAVCLDLACQSGTCPAGSTCNTTNGLCSPSSVGDPSARIGDPCLADAECPPGGACLVEEAITDASGTRLAPRNGYCTILGCRFADTLPDFACPAGSACDNFFYAGGCVRNCDPLDATTCRNDACDPGSGLANGCDWLGDFECVDWSGWNLAVIGLPVVSGDAVICDFVYDSIRSCALGCPGGSTCTDPETGLPSTDGACLDTTASGPPCATNGADGAFCAGECVDRDSDPANCGACGNVCVGGTPNCSGGSCVP